MVPWEKAVEQHATPVEASVTCLVTALQKAKVKVKERAMVEKAAMEVLAKAKARTAATEKVALVKVERAKEAKEKMAKVPEKAHNKDAGLAEEIITSPIARAEAKEEV